MKICWDNLEGLRYNKKTGKWYKGSSTLLYRNKCLYCNEPFLYIVRKSVDGLYCTVECKNKALPPNNKGKNNPNYDNKWSDEQKKKMSILKKGTLIGDLNPAKRPDVRKKISESQKGRDNSGKKNGMYGKKHSEETKKKMKEASSGENSWNWKGGNKTIPFYDIYAPQIDWCEPVRRNQEDSNILEVKCTWCGKWFIPDKWSVNNRVQILKGSKHFRGEHRFYCSDGCKENCPIYNKTPEILMKEDALKAGRLSWLELNREVQPELRQMVFERDRYRCIKCGKIEGLHCHHIEGIRWNPLESADMDSCITVCKNCHKEIHQKEGCGYNDMKCKEI